MVQTVGIDPFLTSLASVDQRRPPETEPDSRRITPATESDTAAADRRQNADPSNTRAETPASTRIAFTAKFGPDSDGFPLQLIRGEQVDQALANDAQAIVENRVPREETRAVLLQAQEAREDATDATRRRDETDAAAAERREAAEPLERRERDDREAIPAEETRQPAGSFLDLQI